jgi:RNA polymerase sigma-70 factor (ECF subfamily)
MLASVGMAQDHPADSVEQEVRSLHVENAAGMLRYAVAVCGRLHAAQDAVQETFLQYFMTRSAGHVIQTPKAWLYRVLRLGLRNSENTRDQGVEVSLHALSQHPHYNPESTELEPVWTVLASVLAPRELECLKLRAEGLKYREIAEVLGLQRGTVGVLLVRAHRKLRNVISTNEQLSWWHRTGELTK